jgi:hypothetical protein
MDIAHAIFLARPEAQWSLNGNTLAGLHWIGPGDAPTFQELEAAWENRPQPPVIVSFRSLAFALDDAGIYSQVKAAALATTQGEIWWNTAQSTTVQRDHPFVAALASAVGQTEEQIDAIFATAATKDQANLVAT